MNLQEKIAIVQVLVHFLFASSISLYPLKSDKISLEQS